MKGLWFLLSTFVCFGQDFIDRHMLPMENDEANKLFEEGKLEEAIKMYQDLYGQNTENGAFAYNLGNAYAMRGDIDQAVDLYQKAMNSDHSEAQLRSRFNLGNLQMAKQEPDKAIENYVDYLRERPDDLDAKRNLELALRHLQEQEQQKQNQQQEDQEEQQKEEQNQQEQNQEQGEEQKKDQEQNQEKNQEQQEQDQQKQQSQQQADKEQEQDSQEQDQQQNQQSQSTDETLNEEMKEKILEALKAKEMEQQKEHQKRKIGKVRRRAKDW